MEIRKMSQSELDKAIEEEIERVWRQNDFVSTGQVVGLGWPRAACRRRFRGRSRKCRCLARRLPHLTGCLQ